jgi:2-dehydropantoate 2-reductase
MARVAVLGPGGVGGFLAAALSHAGVATTVVAREETAAAIATGGLRLSSVRLGEIVATPAVTARLDDDVDVLVVAVKAPVLEASLERVAGTPGLVVPLLNGIDHVDRLRERFGPRAIAASIRISAQRAAPGVIVENGSLAILVELASDHPAPRPRMAAFADVLRAAEVPARLGDSETQVLWSKLVPLNASACTTSAYGVPIGGVRDHPRRRLELENAINESVAVANADGATVDGDAVLRWIWQLDPEHTPSMQRDIAEGRPAEIDAIPGAVLRHAAVHRVACPTIERLVAMIASRTPSMPPPRTGGTADGMVG